MPITISHNANLSEAAPAFLSESVPERLIAYGQMPAHVRKGLEELIETGHRKFNGDGLKVIHMMTNTLCHYMTQEYSPGTEQLVRTYRMKVDETEGKVVGVGAYLNNEEALRDMPLPEQALRFVSGGMGLVLKRYPQASPSRRGTVTVEMDEEEESDPVEPMD